MVFGTFHSAFGFLARPMKGKKSDANHLAVASPRAIRDFMIAKQKECEGTDYSNGHGVASWGLPLHRNQETQGGLKRGITRLWRRESA